MYFGDQFFVLCGVVEDLFLFCLVPFSLLESVLCFTEAFSFRSHLLITALSDCATGDLFRKWSLVPMH